MEPNPRLLPLIGAYNFRDLGGYPTVDGRVTRWGQLFRSDTLHELTEADLKVLRDVGLKTVVDLRTRTELERTGRGLLADEPVHFRHHSVLQEEGGETRAAPTEADTVGQRYLWYLDVGRAALVETLTMAGDRGLYPLVFHCAAGKDRTGVVAALVLDILGVERNVIVEDYVLTASRMELILGRLVRDPADGRSLDELPADAFAVEAATMEEFLDGLYERHDGARGWALAAGVPSECLDAMPTHLLAGES